MNIDIKNMDLPLDFWHNSVECIDVVLEIDKKCLSDVEEWIGIEDVSEIKGKIVAHAILPFDKGLVSKLMSFGTG